MGGILWILNMIIAGILASNKNRSVGGWVLLSAFFGIIPTIILIFLPRIRKDFWNIL